MAAQTARGNVTAFSSLAAAPRGSAHADPEVADMQDAGTPSPRHSGKLEDLACYSQMYAERPEVLRPADVDELAEIFADARAANRKVTLRAGGNAFDAQALGKDLVVSIERLDAIGDVVRLDGDACITVGAGARWGNILAKVEPLGLLPAIMVTTERATAGGTLSGNCLSRFSPTFGKEGGWVKSFRLLTARGERIACTPPADDTDPRAWTLEERTYMAAIGGLGYVGAVYEITYRLVRVYDPDAGGGPAKIAVQSTLTKHKTYEHLAEHLARPAWRMCRRPIPDATTTLAEDPGDQAIYSGLIRRWNGKQSAVVLTSTYTTSTERKTLAIHEPKSRFRFISEFLLRTPVDWLLSLFAFHFLLREGRTYIDDLRGFTFFMDGNANYKAWGKKVHMPMQTLQQTFVVPFDPDQGFASDAEAEDAGCRKLAAWLDESHKILREHRVRPTFSDVLFIRDTLHFGLSSTAGKAGFAASYAFETSSTRKQARIEQAFRTLADRLAEDPYNGRVYLVKCVYASQETLRAMYGDNVVAFLELKRRLDPDDMLHNDFLDRTFGDLARELAAGAPDEGTSA
jgi:decaprenylphospho-beta-D-ribofuranose 2-oxidase